jgi:hypothetical protein
MSDAPDWDADSMGHDISPRTGRGKRDVSPRKVGILGCISLSVATALAVTIVFFDTAIVVADIQFPFLTDPRLAAVLFGVSFVCGLKARATTAGKVALIGSLVLGLLYVGFMVTMFLAFMNPD